MNSSRIAGRRLVGALSAAAVVLTGCGLAESEKTAGTAPPSAPPPITTSTPPPPPPRPFEVPLDEIDPCDLITPEQRGQLGFDRDPLPNAEGGFGDADACSYRNTQGKVGARLALITTEGMGVWTDDTAQVEATPVVISGFPALVIKTPDLNLSCNVAVDVAEGQHIDVLFRDDGGQPAPPLDQLCAGAQRVAEDAMDTLLHPEPETSSSETTSEQPPSEPTS